jgi:predicted ABC-type ATPase
MPTLTVVAGPNGSGKSTITRSLRFEGHERLLDADAIAREFNAADPARAGIAAGRTVLKLTEEYLRQKTSFVIETTLSSPGRLALIRRAKELGYTVHLYFVALDSPEASITRIRGRVAQGGHFVPDEDVRRRYTRSLAMLKQAVPYCDVVKVFDNSARPARLVLVAKSGVVVWRAEALPQWIDY